jgi:hypothetical protein
VACPSPAAVCRCPAAAPPAQWTAARGHLVGTAVQEDREGRSRAAQQRAATTPDFASIKSTALEGRFQDQVTADTCRPGALMAADAAGTQVQHTPAVSCLVCLLLPRAAPPHSRTHPSCSTLPPPLWEPPAAPSAPGLTRQRRHTVACRPPGAAAGQHTLCWGRAGTQPAAARPCAAAAAAVGMAGQAQCLWGDAVQLAGCCEGL